MKIIFGLIYYGQYSVLLRTILRSVTRMVSKWIPLVYSKDARITQEIQDSSLLSRNTYGIKDQQN